MFDHEAGMPPQEQTHRVYLSFQCRDGWQCQFLEADLQTPLPKRLHFLSSDKVVEPSLHFVEWVGREDG
jgi:hypothetical protein